MAFSWTGGAWSYYLMLNLILGLAGLINYLDEWAGANRGLELTIGCVGLGLIPLFLRAHMFLFLSNILVLIGWNYS
jgi:hypothetical protein